MKIGNPQFTFYSIKSENYVGEIDLAEGEVKISTGMMLFIVLIEYSEFYKKSSLSKLIL